MRHGVARGQKQTFDVDAVNSVELLFRDVEHRLIPMRDAGVVHDDVEVAETVQLAVDERLDIAVASYIAGRKQGLPAGSADFEHNPFAARHVDVVDDDL